LEFSFWNLELDLDLEKIEASERGAKFERKARRRAGGFVGRKSRCAQIKKENLIDK